MLTFTNQLTITAAEGTTVKYRLSNGGDFAPYDNSNPLMPNSPGINLGHTLLQVKAVEPGKVPYSIIPFVLNQTHAPMIAEDYNNAIGITSATPGATM